MNSLQKLRRGVQTLGMKRVQMMKMHNQQPPFSEMERTFLEPSEFYEELKKREINFFTGVPDSLLKDLCGFISDNVPQEQHIIAANEGTAVGIAAGYHLATNKFPMVYLQNSGLGNIVNPLMSLCHQKVYKIPMLLVIGWRGEPGKKDEPQHLVQGKVMNGMLSEMGIQSEVLPDYLEGAQETLDAAYYHMVHRQSPYALVVKRQVFKQYSRKPSPPSPYEMNREEALQVVLSLLNTDDVTVGTTGFLSRELEELRKVNHIEGTEHVQRDFLTVGSMGHSSSIALGLSLFQPNRRVFCLDGDGACLMHMGALAQNAGHAQSNYFHILFNNEVHDSVGAQPTQGANVNFSLVAKACGFQSVHQVSTKQHLANTLQTLQSQQGPHFVEVKIRPGARKNLGRPSLSPFQSKSKFIEFLQK